MYIWSICWLWFRLEFDIELRYFSIALTPTLDLTIMKNYFSFGSHWLNLGILFSVDNSPVKLIPEFKIENIIS